MIRTVIVDDQALVRAGRDAAQAGGSAPIGDALGREIDSIRGKIEPVLARELPAT